MIEFEKWKEELLLIEATFVKLPPGRFRDNLAKRVNDIVLEIEQSLAHNPRDLSLWKSLLKEHGIS